MAGVKDGEEALEISRPGWKRAVLQQLQLEGQGASLEVQLGGPQHVEPRLLAAARVLVAAQPSEVAGLSPEQLGRWDRWAAGGALLAAWPCRGRCGPCRALPGSAGLQGAHQPHALPPRWPAARPSSEPRPRPWPRRPLNRANETRALRTLLGVALVALGSFPTTLQQDQGALQAGGLAEELETALRFRCARRAAAGPRGRGAAGLLIPGVAEAGAWAGGVAARRCGAAAPAAQAPTRGACTDQHPPPTTTTPRRMERKQLLVRVIGALGERIKELPGMAGLRPAAAAPPAEKGKAPSAATSKGFGARKQ
jgi:hypothetical protein